MKKIYINNLKKVAAIVAIVSIATSCQEEGGLAYEYMPDMYRSPSIETYVDYGELRGKQGNDSLRNTISAKLPVKGTIPRGFMPYGYDNTPEGYELAGQNLTNPVPYTMDVNKEGKELYGMFCVHCHGKTGQGDGTLVEREKFPPIPTKFNESLSLAEGKMFHTITYGKGLMGSHASQLSQEERWKLVHFIRAEFMKKPAPLAVNTSSDNNADVDLMAAIAYTGDITVDFSNLLASGSYNQPLVLEGVTFKQASAKLKIEESKTTLDAVAGALLKEENKSAKVQLNGHTAKGPNEKLNQTLSEKRASNVKQYLVDKGIDATRIQVRGFGSSQLLSTEDTKEARMKNRRTEIVVIN